MVSLNTLNTICNMEIAPMSVFGYVDGEQMGFAGFDVVAKDDKKRQVDSLNTTHVLRWDAYGNKSGVLLSKEWKSAMLEFTLSPSSMVISDWVTSGGSWHESDPFGRAKNIKYLHQAITDDTAGVSSVQSSANFPQAPSLVVSFLRYAVPPPNINEAIFYITLGGGYTLYFGGMKDPKIIDTDGSRIISTYTVEQNEKKQYYFDTSMKWEIWSVAGDLYILCSSLSRVWIIHDLGNMPAAPVTFGCQASCPYAVMIQKPIFNSSGYFITDEIDHLAEYAGDPDKIATYPPADQGTSVNIAINSTNGNKKSYKVTLNADSGGDHSPYVMSWQVIYRRRFEDKVGTWTKISDDYFKGGRESLGADAPARSLVADFNDTGGKFRAYLDNLGDFIEGQFALRYSTGYNLHPSGSVTIPRLTGIAQIREQNLKATTNNQQYTLTINDRYCQLNDTELTFPPNFILYPPEEAVALAAEYGGVHPDDIYVDIALSPRTVENGAWWGTRGTSTNPDKLLAAAGFEYESLTWMPIGSRAGEFINNVCKLFNMVAEFNPSGQFVIRLKDSSTLVESYTTEEGAANTVTIKDLTGTSDITDKPNGIVVEGKSRDGLYIYAKSIDWASVNLAPGTPGFKGYPAIRWIRDEKLSTQEQCVDALNRAFESLKVGGRRKIQITSPLAGLWDRFPRQLIFLDDAYSAYGGLYYRILSVEVDIKPMVLSATLTAEEVLSPGDLWRGTNPDPLQEIIRDAINQLIPKPDRGGGIPSSITPGDPIPTTWFTLDVSELDGSDILAPW